jgi:hypothetical protein
METCTVETGLLKKKPCGQASVTHCQNCEQPLCTKHAVPQLKPNGLKSGKFMCKECDAARKEFEKNVPPAPPPEPEKKPAEASKGAAARCARAEAGGREARGQRTPRVHAQQTQGARREEVVFTPRWSGR